MLQNFSLSLMTLIFLIEEMVEMTQTDILETLRNFSTDLIQMFDNCYASSINVIKRYINRIYRSILINFV